LSNSKFIHPEAIERRANELLLKHQAKTGVPLAVPIAIERLAEDLLDFQILWDKLPEKDNETILAGLASRKKLVVFNENRLPLFDKTPGLYRTVRVSVKSALRMKLGTGNSTWTRQRSINHQCQAWMSNSNTCFAAKTKVGTRETLIYS
jgi:hypothetical protein